MTTTILIVFDDDTMGAERASVWREENWAKLGGRKTWNTIQLKR
ncbi:MAG: hypothetical protein Q7J68_01270 [Thermoplasmata archaeon]|nr:hypothetical protein [Thermoplasmata archaeon]